MSKDHQLPVRIDGDIYEELEKIAESLDRSRGEIVRCALWTFMTLAPEQRLTKLREYLVRGVPEKPPTPKRKKK